MESTSQFDVPELIQQMCAFLRQRPSDSPLTIGRRAGVLYLGVVSAMHQCGLLEPRHAPDILIQVDGSDYEVRSSLQEPLFVGQGMTRTASSVIALAARASHRVRRSRRSRACNR